MLPITKGDVSATVGLAATFVRVAPFDAWMALIIFATPSSDGEMTQEQLELLEKHPLLSDAPWLPAFSESLRSYGDPKRVPSALAGLIFGDSPSEYFAKMAGTLSLGAHHVWLSAQLAQNPAVTTPLVRLREHNDEDRACLHCKLRLAFVETFDMTEVDDIPLVKPPSQADQISRIV
jgi:hypothetical protein